MLGGRKKVESERKTCERDRPTLVPKYYCLPKEKRNAAFLSM